MSFLPDFLTKQGSQDDDMVPVLNNDKKMLYFSRLSKLGVKQEIAITLHEVAEVTFTSSRHCRTLFLARYNVKVDYTFN
ncbi:SgrR family transcriptional regulator [Moritella viscosa]